MCEGRLDEVLEKTRHTGLVNRPTLTGLESPLKGKHQKEPYSHIADSSDSFLALEGPRSLFMATVGINSLEGPFTMTKMIGPMFLHVYGLQKTVPTLSPVRPQHYS